MVSHKKFESITLIGPIAPPPWGPAARNRIMLDTLHEWGMKIRVVNTLEWKKKPIRFLIRMVIGSLITRRVIIGVSQNGRKVILPILMLFSLLFPMKIIFFPAGGGIIDKEISSMPWFLRKIFILCCRRCFLIAVELDNIRTQLNKHGISNVIILRNFKRRPQLMNVKETHNEKIKILFLSRVRQLKGIEVLFNALDLLPKKLNFSLDIYGLVDEDYKPILRTFLDTRPYAKYRGVIDYDKVIPQISSYNIMVFPTLREEEGCPGVLVEAAIAGLPIVASDVSSNKELIIDGHNGLICKKGDAKSLSEKIEILINNPTMCEKMSENNKNMSIQFDADHLLKNFWIELKKRGW
jgi:glycosyltransferase involved in cell wall biosynthesis